ncbi:hypothetical protein EYF80_033952 [Liparis tanakae]|uniref:Uncharacterized protein n=1 Tax=Liparis tanakae TaxID=230148 RepID=A0A4Z2GRA9_9TELE|nr:hypothetical protein EYF80_033952 [Liparis tanakae]
MNKRNSGNISTPRYRQAIHFCHILLPTLTKAATAKLAQRVSSARSLFFQKMCSDTVSTSVSTRLRVEQMLGHGFDNKLKEEPGELKPGEDKARYPGDRLQEMGTLNSWDDRRPSLRRGSQEYPTERHGER